MFPPNEKVKIGEMRVQINRILLSFCSTDDITQYCYLYTLYYSKTVKQQIDFHFSKKQSIINHC